MAEVNSISINVKDIVDTAVAQFKTAIQEAVTSDVARAQGLVRTAQAEIAAEREALAVVQKERAREQAGLIEEQAERATVRQETVAERAKLEALKAETQATERARMAAREAYHAVPQ
jgi:hypothetical protein